MKAFSMFSSVMISGVTFFVLTTEWIPPGVKIIASFLGGTSVGLHGSIEERDISVKRGTIENVIRSLNRQLEGKEEVTVVEVLALLEEMKEKN